MIAIIISDWKQVLPQKPYIISKAVFAARGPFEQIAAQALEKCGDVKIIDDDDQGRTG